MLHSSLANYSISELASTGSGLNDLVDNDGNDAETAATSSAPQPRNKWRTVTLLPGISIFQF